MPKNKKHKDIPIKVLIVVSVLFVIMIVGVVSAIHTEKYLTFGDLKIKPKTLKDISDVIPEGSFIICDMQNDACSIFNKYNLIE